MDKIARTLALLSAGLLAGAFLAAFFTVVPTWYEVPREVHFTYRVALMRHNAIYMQIVMGLGILTPAWWAYTMRNSPSARTCAILASLMALTSLLVTRFGNVPINRMIQTWSAIAPPANYMEQLQRWTVFHDIRTATAAACFLLVVVADLLQQ
jgi:uncharacterized membrane protein